MRKARSIGVALALVALVAAGCESKQQTGTVVGGFGGAALGHVLGGGFWGTAAGALIGGLVGSQVGKSLDKEDVKRADAASQRAMEQNRAGQATTWSNPETGATGTVTPTTDAYADSGTVCRDFQQSVAAGGSTHSGTGRACKQADGSWKVIN